MRNSLYLEAQTVALLTSVVATSNTGVVWFGSGRDKTSISDELNRLILSVPTRRGDGFLACWFVCGLVPRVPRSGKYKQKSGTFDWRAMLKQNWEFCYNTITIRLDKTTRVLLRNPFNSSTQHVWLLPNVSRTAFFMRACARLSSSPAHQISMSFVTATSSQSERPSGIRRRRREDFFFSL